MNIRKTAFIIMIGILLGGCGLSKGTPQALPSPYKASDADLTAIRQSALDYVEGWYRGDAGRMERCLHPDAVVRSQTDDRIKTVTAEQMIQSTQQGAGMGYVGKKEFTVTILDVYNDISNVRVDSPEYVDYLQIVKIKGEWLIVNVLWTDRLA